jgi:hypothetical protein
VTGLRAIGFLFKLASKTLENGYAARTSYILSSSSCMRQIAG